MDQYYYVITEVFKHSTLESQLIPRRMWRIPTSIYTPYNECRSFHAFNSYKKHRNTKPDGTLYHVEYSPSYQERVDIHVNVSMKRRIDENHFKTPEELEYWLNYWPALDKIPLVKDTWEFYKIVGYDYKTKKWV